MNPSSPWLCGYCGGKAFSGRPYVDAGTRRIIAYVAGKLKLSEKCTAVFDHADHNEHAYTGMVHPDHISIYDFDRKCHVGGKRAPLIDTHEYYSLYDFGNGRHFTLSFDDTRLIGFDHRLNKGFSGFINGRTVTIRDEEVGKEFYYSV